MKEITMTLDRKDVTKVIRFVKKNGNISENIQKAIARVCEKACDVAKVAYGGSTSVYFNQVDEHNYEIVADGNQVCFLEFGTGYSTDEAYPLLSEANLSFEVKKGSWSLENARTFQQHDAKVQAGLATEEEYQFNREPKRGLLQAYNYIKANLGTEIKA